MKKSYIFLLLAVVAIFFSACNEACVCDVTWNEYYPVGQESNHTTYELTDNHATYIVYTHGDMDCYDALYEEYKIKYNYNSSYSENRGIRKISCHEK